MSDPQQIDIWLDHIVDLKNLCYEKVNNLYWDNLELLKADLSLMVS